MITIIYKTGRKEEIKQPKGFCEDQADIQDSGNFLIISYYKFDKDTGTHVLLKKKYVPMNLIKEVILDL